MRDKDIIKALEVCDKEYLCVDCPLYETEPFRCRDALVENTIDLINRQHAEIERLNTLVEIGMQRAKDYRAMRDIAKTARAEAIKVFAEKLKEYKCSYDLDNYHSFEAIDVDDIDEVIKEMIGEQE